MSEEDSPYLPCGLWWTHPVGGGRDGGGLDAGDQAGGGPPDRRGQLRAHHRPVPEPARQLDLHRPPQKTKEMMQPLSDPPTSSSL